jgi:hypothetical protein
MHVVRLFDDVLEVLAKEHEHIFWALAVFCHVHHHSDILIAVRLLRVGNATYQLSVVVSDLMAVRVEVVQLRVLLFSLFVFVHVLHQSSHPCQFVL